MSRKLLIVITAVLVASMALSSSALAQGLPGSGWWTGTQIQNVGPSQATVNVTLYDSASASTFSTDVLIDPGASTTLIPTAWAGLTAGFQGSGVVSSNQPVKAITNVTNQPAGSFGTAGGTAAAQYQGTEASATTLYFPLAKHNWFGETTAYYIQNAGTSSATAQVVFRTDDGGVYNFTTPAIDPGKMAVVLPSDAGVPNGPSNNATRVNIGSASVTSAQPLAGTVLEFRVAEVTATVLKGTRSLTSSDFDSKAYAPVAKNSWFGRFTGIQVQNVSGASINFTITYKGTGGTCNGQTIVDTHTGLAPNTSKTFVNLAGQSALPANCLAAATIEGTGDFVAIVNEANLSGSSSAGITYYALPNGAATTKVSAPLFKDGFYNFSTGLQIQNVGAAAATNVVATFACKGGNGAATPFTAVSTPKTIQPGAAFLFYKPALMPAGTFTGANPFVMRGANCGVTITGDQPLVTIQNEAPDTAGALDDNNYEGFNLAP